MKSKKIVSEDVISDEELNDNGYGDAISGCDGIRLSKMDNVIEGFITTCDEMLITQESVLINKDDIYFNFDKFESGECNILLITGLSGSGKSTLASSLSNKYNAEIIELDIFENNKEYSDENLHQAGEVFEAYLFNTERGKKFRNNGMNGNSLTNKELRDEITLFMKFVISYCTKKDKKYIIEGVQIYSNMESNDIKKYPLIILGTSAKNSMLRRFKRNGDGKIEWSKELIDDFPNLLRWYWNDDKQLKVLKKSLNNSV